MSRSRVVVLGAAVLLMVPAAAPVSAQDAALPDGWTVLATGLNAPRGLTIADDGTIYVAEAGLGGTDCVDGWRGPQCSGMTGSIGAYKDGAYTQVVTGLASFDDAGESMGPGDVVVDPDGHLEITMNAGSNRADLLPQYAAQYGYVLHIAEDGTITTVADFAGYEAANNPDSADPGSGIDSDIYGMVRHPDGTLYVVDAGGNVLYMVGDDGELTVASIFHATMVPAPVDPAASPDPAATPAMIPMQAVPTGVTVGPDGDLYVAQLTGVPFPKGGASVFRVPAGGGEAEVYASGFSAIQDVAFGPDGTLYVLEYTHNGLTSGDPTGGLWAVPAGGGEAVLIATDPLVMPGALAVDGNGTIFVTNHSMGKAAPGELLSFTR